MVYITTRRRLRFGGWERRMKGGPVSSIVKLVVAVLSPPLLGAQLMDDCMLTRSWGMFLCARVCIGWAQGERHAYVAALLQHAGGGEWVGEQ